MEKESKKEWGKKRVDIYVSVTDMLYYTPKTNTIL